MLQANGRQFCKQNSDNQMKEVILKYSEDEEIILSMETDTPSVRGMTGGLLQLKQLEFEEREEKTLS